MDGLPLGQKNEPANAGSFTFYLDCGLLIVFMITAFLIVVIGGRSGWGWGTGFDGDAYAFAVFLFAFIIEKVSGHGVFTAGRSHWKW